MKKKEDLIKTLLDTLKELTTAKSHPLTKPMQSFIVNSASNSDLNSSTSIGKSEPLSEQLTQGVNLNNVDGEEPPQNKKVKRSLQDQLEEVKKKKKEEFYASKNSNSKDNHTSSSQDLYPKNTIVIAGDSIINGVFEDKLRRKKHVVKVRNFPGANVEDMRHNLIPLIRKKPSNLIIHAGTNDAKKFTSREILDQLLNLKKFVSEQVPDCKVIISTLTVRSDDGKAGLTVNQLTNHLRQLKTDIVDNTNITSRHIGINGLHLNSGTTQLAKNFANIIKKICMNEGCSGIEKNRILESEHPLCSSCSDVMPNISTHTFSSEGTSNNSKIRNMREPVSINTVTTNDVFKTKLKDIRITNLNRIVISHININSIRNKFELVAEAVVGNVDILMVTETKTDESFPTSQFIIPGFTSPYRFDRTKDGGGILVYIREDIPSKLLNISYIASDIEWLGIEVNLRKVKWLVICSYNPHKNNISNHLENLSKVLNRNLSQYERFLCTGDFNSEITEFAMKKICDIYHLKNLVNVPTCYKNPLKPSCIDLFLTNCSRSFQDTQVIETGLSDFHKMNITVLKMFFSKQKHDTVFFRNYKKFDNSAFREALNRELLKYDLNNIEYDTFQEIIVSLLNAYTPLKKKISQSKSCKFGNKGTSKSCYAKNKTYKH